MKSGSAHYIIDLIEGRNRKVNQPIMNKKEAIEALEKGHRMQHYHFTDGEYIYLDEDGDLRDEGGRTLDWDDFWHWRKTDDWDKDWGYYQKI